MNKNTSIKTVRLINEINPKIDWNTKETEQLITGILALKNINEAKCFLRDLMTEGEIKEFSSRLEAARLLSKNTQYTEIINKTGLSSTTIARISKWLNGPLGGYRLILNRISPSTTSGTSHHPLSNKLGKGLS